MQLVLSYSDTDKNQSLLENWTMLSVTKRLFYHKAGQPIFCLPGGAAILITLIYLLSVVSNHTNFFLHGPLFHTAYSRIESVIPNVRSRKAKQR